MTKEEKIKELEEVYKDDRFILRSELINLEHNNGWIKILSEEDLPKEKCDVWIFNSFGDIEQTEFNADYKSFNGYFSSLDRSKVTHYMIIEKPQTPFY